MAEKYGIAETLVAAALLCIAAMIASLKMIMLIRSYLEAYIDCKFDQQYDKPKDQSVVVNFPNAPNWVTLPPPTKVNSWAPVVVTTKMFLALPNFSDQDKETMKLNKFETAQRPGSADNFDYPTIHLKAENGEVIIRTNRGTKYKNKLVRFIIDRNNEGIYEELTNSVNRDVRIPIIFPVGVQRMTWSIRAIYMENGQVLGKWCPPVSIVLQQEAPTITEPPVVVPEAEQAMSANGNGLEVM